MARKKVAERTDGPEILSGEIRQVDILSIVPHPENARRGNVPAIKSLIEANGFYGKVLVWKETGQIVIGSHRWKAMVELGAKTIPAEFVSLSEDHARRILAGDNRSSDLAGYDDELQAALLTRLSATGDLKLSGYSDDDLEAARKRLAPKAAPGEFPELNPGGMHLARECPKCGFCF